MNCQELSQLLDAYIDKELDVVTSSQFDRHVTECPACRARRDRYQQMHDSVAAHMEYFEVPQGFEQRIRAKLYPAPEHESKTIRRDWLDGWRTWAMAASLVAVLLLATVLVQIARRPSEADVVAEQVVSSHVRSLLANHLSDVISTDQHTVKPWFAGKLDFAPVVKDLSSKGFPLVGGRLDYLNDHTAAALVYKRRQHTVNLFQWPTAASDASPRTLAVRGYNMVHWIRSHMAYWAVSDLNASELAGFARDLED